MLAREFKYEQQEEVQQTKRELHFAQLKKEEASVDMTTIWQIAIVCVIVMVVGAVACGIQKTTHYAAASSAAKLQEAAIELAKSNQLLKLEVEQLKSPTRIRRIAKNQLGLMEARSNVVVETSPVQQTNKTAYALSHK